MMKLRQITVRVGGLILVGKCANRVYDLLAMATNQAHVKIHHRLIVPVSHPIKTQVIIQIITDLNAMA
jgi:hypothetical protein